MTTGISARQKRDANNRIPEEAGPPPPPSSSSRWKFTQRRQRQLAGPMRQSLSCHSLQHHRMFVTEEAPVL
ncbi:hypothetical protein AAFF_G00304710 [Aldrovandia affinis]|uniref:Uncharacterized protein n=1 Tax=Aldrovandia affinis TaxID=143900 RepID=A0AAD7SPG2_9TELE|nr:hypothetical protein AAFF_G00304710 [Aldrovandia affinis]